MVFYMEMAKQCPKQPADLQIGISLKQQHRGINTVSELKKYFTHKLALNGSVHG